MSAKKQCNENTASRAAARKRRRWDLRSGSASAATATATKACVHCCAFRFEGEMWWMNRAMLDILALSSSRLDGTSDLEQWEKYKQKMHFYPRCVFIETSTLELKSSSFFLRYFSCFALSHIIRNYLENSMCCWLDSRFLQWDKLCCCFFAFFVCLFVFSNLYVVWSQN